ncbi:MBL fold metallo-hydrolase [Lutimonas halocynthiae]|uniref:MBL fold metallo-hydrolase n=1 Tax=Lutimonas halocynthiae TaxID=1446477 RepID=UPI0025B3F4CF|nr:MBL fold metallo-hydrolase [Lutimonas halocynthiae]MDN3644221.1 MBL fold metallo-hydrolase [Lutimonas halocynthiae]
MKITFLGTGTSQGIPIIGSKHEVCLSSDLKDKRLRSSILVEWENASYVIDCGPDFRQQLLRAEVDKLDGILFTHYHADHTAGLDDVRPFSQRNGHVDFHCDTAVAENLKERFAYIFATENRYAGAPKVSLNIIDNQGFELKNKFIQPIEVMHGNLKIFGFRIEKFAYITDAKTISQQEKEKLRGLDVLVVNALRKHPHPTHFNVDEALSFINEIKPKKAYLTHISSLLGFHKVVSNELPPNVFLAYDGLMIDL